VGEYMFDVPDFRTDQRDRVIRDINEMTRRRFALARHLRDTRDWGFFMLVEMGTDRLHHALWRFWDPHHPDYEPDTAYGRAFRDYYRYLDGEVGSLIEGLDEGTAMYGGIQVNEWLIKEGYLSLLERPSEPTPIGRCAVDWANTRVWADGGYYSRVFLNVAGREPQGTVPPEQYEALRDELIAKLEALGNEHGESIGTRVFRPGDLYHEVKNIPPDLICYFGDLSWRSIGVVGDGRVHVRENDTGPDDANHAKQGIVIAAGPGMPSSFPADAHLFDIAPTVLHAMGRPVPEDMQGRVLS
jgi:predicted AlkP superfamily phosphohydrolase/phosphomutase